MHPGQPHLHGVWAPSRLGDLVPAVSPEAMVGLVCVCTRSFSSLRADCTIAGAVGVGGAVPRLQFILPDSLDLQNHEPPSLPSPRVTSKATSHTSTRSWSSASRTLSLRCPRCADGPARGQGRLVLVLLPPGARALQQSLSGLLPGMASPASRLMSVPSPRPGTRPSAAASAAGLLATPPEGHSISQAAAVHFSRGLFVKASL